jgi:hypothetical protein
MAENPFQESTSEEIESVNHVVSLVPQYFINNGLRVDYDLKINNQHWIQFAPMFYFRENHTTDYERYYNINRMNGYGLHNYYRFYPGDGFGYSNFYISYGGVYQYYNLYYNEGVNTTETERFSRITKFG